MYRGIYRRRTRKRYDILCNGTVIGYGTGYSAVEAIRHFARMNYIRTGTSRSFGECGFSYSYCRKYCSVYACGKSNKCHKVTCVKSSIGIIYTYD